MTQFSGNVEILNNAGNKVTIRLDGQTADIIIGGNGADGNIIIKDSVAKEAISLSGNGREMNLKDAAGKTRFRVIGEQGRLYLRDAAEKEGIGLLGDGREISIKDAAGKTRFRAIGEQGRLYLRDAAEKEGIGLLGDGREISIKDAAGKTRFRAIGEQGRLYLRDAAEKEGIGLLGDGREIYIKDAAEKMRVRIIGGQGRMYLRDAAEKEGIGLLGDGREMYIKDAAGKTRFRVIGEQGRIYLFDASGNERICLDADAGDIRLSGADCAEDFNVLESEKIEAGSVLVVNQENTLQQSYKAYDKRVVGVVSGAGNFKPGIVLDKKHTQNKRVPVALTGKVYCKVEAQYSPIEVGDLLTTSNTSGHAMKASDPLKAFGAVIGKALCGLKEGQGLIPILVSLQ